MRICIINKSTHPEITEATLVQIAAALAVQSARDLAGWWEVTPDQFMVASYAPAGWDQMLITDLLDAPDAVAYHTRLANGRPLLRVGADVVASLPGRFIDQLSIAMSHEWLETRLDPYANFWSEYDAKKMVALEIADPVQGDSYLIDGVAVSNFVGPHWFDPSARRDFDLCGKLTKPLTLSAGGYLIFDDGTQTFGEAFPESKRAVVTSALGRRARARAAA